MRIYILKFSSNWRYSTVFLTWVIQVKNVWLRKIEELHINIKESKVNMKMSLKKLYMRILNLQNEIEITKVSILSSY